MTFSHFHKLAVLFMACVYFTLLGCQSGGMDRTLNKNNGITHGAVQLHLKRGVTTQSDVLEIFGAPNIATTNAEGHEIWTYQRHGINETSSGAYGTLFVVGGTSSGFERNSRSLTLLIKFDSTNTVIDFQSRYSSF